MRSKVKNKAGSVTYSVLDRATGRFVPYSPPRPSAQRRSAARSPSNSSSINWGGDGGFADLPCSALSLEQAVLPVKLLGGSSDGREAIFVVGLPRPKHARVAVAVLGVRLAQFSSGAEQLVSWCSSPYCMGRDDLDLIFPGQDFPQQSADDVLRGIEPLCTCGRAAVRIAGGEAALAARLRSTPPATPGQVMTWHHDGKGLSCVHAGGDTGWGIVGQHGEQPWCLTCSSRQRSCEHVAVLGGGAAAASGPLASWLAPADFEARLNEDFDRETGQRRLTCLSREPLPARPEDDLELDALLAARKAGHHQLPTVAVPAQHACPECGGCAWAVREGQPCRTYLQTQVITVRFDELVCTASGCSGTLHIDGKELGLLRKTPTFAVGLDVLYEWRTVMKDGGEAFYRFWRSLLGRYSAPLPELRAAMQLRSQFEGACMDFMQLQGQDYEGSFWCEHMEDGGHLSVDCVTIGVHTKQAFMVAPWHKWRGEAGSAPLVHGSSFQDRVFFLADAISRTALLDVCSKQGITAEDHQRLIATLEAAAADRPERALLPFLRRPTTVPGGNVTLCGQPHCKLVRDLATRAPACAILKPSVYGVVDALLAAPNAAALGTDQHRSFAHHCPVLYAFLQPHLSTGELPAEVCALLKALRSVSEAAFQPSAAPGQATTAPHERHQSAARVAFAAACDAGLPPPEDWRSAEEAFLRCACWGGPPQRDGWQPTPYGGSHILYALPEYAADHSNRSDKRTTCTKHQDQNGKLMPGLLLFWCVECRKCVFFQMLPDAESPLVVMRALRTRWPRPPKSITYDNNCNSLHQTLNRECEWFRPSEWFIDQPHFRGHKHCPDAFNTGKYKHIKCSPLAEQHNKRLRHLENHVSYMRQARALWHLRTFLYLSNELIDDVSADRCFYK